MPPCCFSRMTQVVPCCDIDCLDTLSGRKCVHSREDGKKNERPVSRSLLRRRSSGLPLSLVTNCTAGWRRKRVAQNKGWLRGRGSCTNALLCTSSGPLPCCYSVSPHYVKWRLESGSKRARKELTFCHTSRLTRARNVGSVQQLKRTRCQA